MNRAPFTIVEGRAYPLGLPNVDTDVIIASVWLKTIARSGLGQAAFAVLRSKGDSVFDDPAYAKAPILIAGENFGCGSSREHAAWALADMGLKVVIAPSFSDIFAGNAFKNGLLTIVLPRAEVDQLLELAEQGAIRIDLAAQMIFAPTGAQFRFATDPFRKECLQKGFDEIELTLAVAHRISEYEQASPSYLWLPGLGES